MADKPKRRHWVRDLVVNAIHLVKWPAVTPGIVLMKGANPVNEIDEEEVGLCDEIEKLGTARERLVHELRTYPPEFVAEVAPLFAPDVVEELKREGLLKAATEVVEMGAKEVLTKCFDMPADSPGARMTEMRMNIGGVNEPTAGMACDGVLENLSVEERRRDPTLSREQAIVKAMTNDPIGAVVARIGTDGVLGEMPLSKALELAATKYPEFAARLVTKAAMGW